MNYRILPPDEWLRLTELVDPQFIPSSSSALAAVAEDDDGRLAGVLFIQMAMHMEPIVLTSPKVNFLRLHELLYNAMRDHKGLQLYAFAESDIVGKMAERAGMTLTPYAIYSQEVR